MRLVKSDYMTVIRERSGSSKRTEDSDHKEVLTFTLRSDEEHVRALTKNAANNMTSSFEPNAHTYVLSNLFTGLYAIGRGVRVAREPESRLGGSWFESR